MAGKNQLFLKGGRRHVGNIQNPEEQQLHRYVQHPPSGQAAEPESKRASLPYAFPARGPVEVFYPGGWPAFAGMGWIPCGMGSRSWKGPDM